ncbi:hypothetical protein AAG570_001194 [Ranatra chinensis]|uniref:Uncharacterized protein n=1 Tax=Ranatra chinensis TaxID=642074 RepID=A0ABD0YB56_9HEMI
MASKLRNMFFENKKQETTEIVRGVTGALKRKHARINAGSRGRHDSSRPVAPPRFPSWRDPRRRAVCVAGGFGRSPHVLLVVYQKVADGQCRAGMLVTSVKAVEGQLPPSPPPQQDSEMGQEAHVWAQQIISKYLLSFTTIAARDRISYGSPTNCVSYLGLYILTREWHGTLKHDLTFTTTKLTAPQILSLDNTQKIYIFLKPTW